jgi:heme/copper-type cytochrome/quinol oxidase subunit 4
MNFTNLTRPFGAVQQYIDQNATISGYNYGVQQALSSYSVRLGLIVGLALTHIVVTRMYVKALKEGTDPKRIELLGTINHTMIVLIFGISLWLLVQGFVNYRLVMP